MRRDTPQTRSRHRPRGSWPKEMASNTRTPLDEVHKYGQSTASVVVKQAQKAAGVFDQVRPDLLHDDMGGHGVPRDVLYGQHTARVAVA